MMPTVTGISVISSVIAVDIANVPLELRGGIVAKLHAAPGNMSVGSYTTGLYALFNGYETDYGDVIRGLVQIVHKSQGHGFLPNSTHRVFNTVKLQLDSPASWQARRSISEIFCHVEHIKGIRWSADGLCIFIEIQQENIGPQTKYWLAHIVSLYN
jgi:hypothetical protein